MSVTLHVSAVLVPLRNRNATIYQFLNCAMPLLPLWCVSCWGRVHEALVFLQCLANYLSSVRGNSYSHVLIVDQMCLALALTSLKQPPFVSIEHVYINEVEPVLMMELASLVFFSGLLFIVMILILICDVL